MQIGIKIGAIYVFFRSPDNINLIGIFGFYVVITMYINLVIDNFQRRKIDADRVSFAAVHSIIFLLTTSLGFGATYFGQVSSKLGGGRPQEVLLTLSKDIKELVPKSISTVDRHSIKGRLIYQTDKYLFLDVAEQTLRFRTDDIALIIVNREKQDAYLKLFEGLRRKLTNNAVERDVPHTFTLCTGLRGRLFHFLSFSVKSVWTFPAVSVRSIGHPASLPEELPHHLIQPYTFKEDVERK